MSEISRFRGIRVLMFHNDHLPPHFHATYGSRNVRVHIGTGEVSGTLPHSAARNLREWYDLHRDELVENWRRAMARLPLSPIEPLDP